MGCSNCGGSKSIPNPKIKAKTVETVTPCEYTMALMYIWLEKLNCIKSQQLFSELGVTKDKINYALGDVQSAINTQNPCVFKVKLDAVNLIILALINIGKC